MTRMPVGDCQLWGKMYYGRDLSELNTWRVGGSSECFYCPRDTADLSCFLRHCRSVIPVFFLGRGSNVLIPDAGISGCVVGLTKTLNTLEHENEIVRAEAGASCQGLVRYCAVNGLGGLEFLVGIPGSIGGALAMNAGALGNEIWSAVRGVTTIDRQGQVHERLAADFSYGYRTVSGPKEWFLAAEFVVQRRDSRQSREQVRQILRERKAMQPVNTFSCGSVFKNPHTGFAASLIEECGQKGRRVGDAEVSRQHANFIINRGQATASDIRALIMEVQHTVQEKTAVLLEPEVVILEA